MTYTVKVLLAISLWSIVAACEQVPPGEPSPADKVLKELKQLYEEAREKIPDDPIKWAKEDLQRSGDWEYRVVLLAAEDSEMLEAKLNEFGRDRWEVFWIREENESVTVFMKRPAKSYLKSVPLSEIGKAVSGSESHE